MKIVMLIFWLAAGRVDQVEFASLQACVDAAAVINGHARLQIKRYSPPARPYAICFPKGER